MVSSNNLREATPLGKRTLLISSYWLVENTYRWSLFMLLPQPVYHYAFFFFFFLFVFFFFFFSFSLPFFFFFFCFIFFFFFFPLLQNALSRAEEKTTVVALMAVCAVKVLDNIWVKPIILHRIVVLCGYFNREPASFRASDKVKEIKRSHRYRWSLERYCPSMTRRLAILDYIILSPENWGRMAKYPATGRLYAWPSPPLPRTTFHPYQSKLKCKAKSLQFHRLSRSSWWLMGTMLMPIASNVLP